MLHSHATAAAAATTTAASSTGTVRSSTSPLGVYAQLEARFTSLVGTDALDKLHSLPPSRHAVIVISGDQCTGKSTLASRLATHLGGKRFAAGELFRRRARELGITSAELSRRALADPSIDVGIEYALCELLIRGDSDGPLIIEGRQPAVMENFVRARLHQPGATFRLRLSCTILEQASRYIEREFGLEARDAIVPHLPANAARLSDLTPTLKKLQRPEMAKLIAAFDDNDSRDEDDRKRFESLYGANSFLDHRNPALYDTVIDTTPNKSEDTFRQAQAALAKHLDAKQLKPEIRAKL